MASSLARSLRLLIFCLAPLIATSVHTAHADTAQRDWRRITSDLVPADRLVMVTDLGARDAKLLLGELELFDAFIDEFVAPFVPLARQIAPELVAREMQVAEKSRQQGKRAALRVVVMRRRTDFTRLFSAGHFAAFTIPTLARTTLVVGPTVGTESIRTNLLHEYVHYRMRRDVPGGLPLWFEEGLASFLSQVKFAPVDFEPAQATGSHLYKLGLWRESEGAPDMPIDQLLSFRDLRGVSRSKTQSFYRTAHALVRYLYLHANLDKQQLASSLVLGQPKFTEQAGFDLQAAKKSVRSLRPNESRSVKWQSSRGFEPRNAPFLWGQFTAHEQSAAFSASSMSTNDVRELLAESTLLINAPASERLYARVRKSEPTRLSATLGYVRSLRFQIKTEEAAAVLEEAESTQPDAWGLMLERSLLDTSGCIVDRRPECAQRWRDAVFNLRDVLEMQPDSFEAIYRLGLAHLYIGQPGESLGYLEIAWRRAPWSARVNYFLGENLRLIGDSRARWYLQNAARWAASDYFREASRMALEELEPALSSPVSDALK